MRSKICPLCGKKAGYTDSSHVKETKCYYCERCLNFIISKTAEEIISKYPKHQRLSYSIKSTKAFISELLVIGTKEVDGQTHIDFKYEPENKWICFRSPILDLSRP